jgi:hypothetical protein
MNIEDATGQIDKLNGYVKQYYALKELRDGEHLSMLLQKITGLLFYLEAVRSAVHSEFETTIFNLVKDGATVARATNQAHVECPLMYQLRRTMDAGYRITDAIRTNISYIKSEKQSTNKLT